MPRQFSVSFDGTRQELLKDPAVAAGYLEECLADGDIDLFKAALKHVADARLGGMTALSEATGRSRESLYRALSREGNPRLDTLTSVLKALGLHMGIAVNEPN